MPLPNSLDSWFPHSVSLAVFAPKSPAQGPAQTAGSGGLLFSEKIQLQGPQPAVPFEGRQGKESHILIFTLNLVGILTHLPQPLVCIRDPQPDWKDLR